MKILRIDGIEYKMEDKLYDRVIEKRRIELCELQKKNNLLEREKNKLKSNNSRKNIQIEYFKEKIKDVIFQLEHNPRTNAETRDKYIIDELKKLLEDNK